MRTLAILFSLIMMVSCGDDNIDLTKNNLIGEWEPFLYEVNDNVTSVPNIYYSVPQYLLFRENDFFTSAYCIGSWDLENDMLFLEGYCNAIRNCKILDYEDNALLIESTVINNGFYPEFSDFFGIEPGEEFVLKEYYRRKQ